MSDDPFLVWWVGSSHLKCVAGAHFGEFFEGKRQSSKRRANKGVSWWLGLLAWQWLSGFGIILMKFLPDNQLLPEGSVRGGWDQVSRELGLHSPCILASLQP